MAPGLFAFRGFVAEGLRDQGRSQGWAKGWTEGRTEGWREGRVYALTHTLLRLLELRRIALSETDRERISSCRDCVLLARWTDRALTARTAEDLFSGDGLPRPSGTPAS